MSKTGSGLIVVAALALFASSLAALWIWAVPAEVSHSSFAFIVLFVIGGATVTLLSWRNAQATSTVGQLLQATEAGDADRARR